MNEEKYEQLMQELDNIYGNEIDLRFHVENVEDIAMQICEVWGVEDDFKQWISLGCFAHDIGKTEKVKKWYKKKNFSTSNHRKMGADYLSQKYKVKDYVVNMVRYHNGKIRKKDSKKLSKKAKIAIAIVHTADQIANKKIKKLMH